MSRLGVRRRTGDSSPYCGAFRTMHLEYLRDSVKEVRSRLLAHEPMEVTPDDILRLFVKPEHREIAVKSAFLFQARQVSSFQPVIGTSTGDYLKITVDLHEPRGSSQNYHFLYPKYIGSYTNHDEREALLKLRAWVDRRFELGKQLGIMWSLLSYFNDRFDDEKTVRYVWPGLLGLCKLSENLDNLSERLKDIKPPKTIPALPLTVSEAVRQSTVLTTKALLLPEKPPASTFNSAPRTLSGVRLVYNGGHELPLPWNDKGSYVTL